MKRLYREIYILILCAAMITWMSGCAIPNSTHESLEQETTVADTTEVTTQIITEATTEEQSTESTTEEQTTVEEGSEETDSEKSETEKENESENINEEEYPSYDGEAFVQLNDNNPEFTAEEKKNTEAFEIYSDLDSLGRCGVAFANICKEIMPTEERGEIGDVRPSGWHVVKYSELIEDNYLYNRSHLIAFSLAGENANEKNLITGTRYLNQETMQIFELKVLDYVRSTDNHVLYRVTPVFEGDNLLATGVKMEAWSVEDDGKGICFNVFCYNVQPGIDIDYATGDSKLADDYEEAGETTTEEESHTEILLGADTEASTENDKETTTQATEKTVLSGEDEERTYILNTNSKKIHLPTCSSVNDMAEHNKYECVSSITELKEKGYDPCGRCLAEYR